MGLLNESSTFEANIYQLETTDPLAGGPVTTGTGTGGGGHGDGILNLATRQLANRTRWLRDFLQAGTYAAGDLLYATGASTLARLGIGAANRVLTSSGSAPQWSDSLILPGSVRGDGGLEARGSAGGAVRLRPTYMHYGPSQVLGRVDIASEDTDYPGTLGGMIAETPASANFGPGGGGRMDLGFDVHENGKRRALTLQGNGTAAFAGVIVGQPTTSNAQFALSVAGGAVLEIVNGSSVVVCSVSFSGLVIVSRTNINEPALYLVDTHAGFCVLVHGSATFSNVAGTANKLNFYISAGQLMMQNLTGGYVAARCMILRTN